MPRQSIIMGDEPVRTTMPRYTAWVLWVNLSLLSCGLPAQAKAQQPPIVPRVKSNLPDAQGTGASAGEQLPDQRLSGSISGIIVDQTGAPDAGARVRLSREDQSPDQEVLSGDDGRFSFANVAPGPFQLTITSAGFATQASSGILRSGGTYTVPQIALALATAVTEVRVIPSPTEVAEDQIRVQENQRVVGVFSSFYVRYEHHALHPAYNQKLQLPSKPTLR